MEDDPLEMHNLLLGSPAPDARKQADAMRRDLTEWEKAHGFATSLDGSGELIRSEPPAGPPRATNSQFPTWVENPCWYDVISL